MDAVIAELLAAVALFLVSGVRGATGSEYKAICKADPQQINADNGVLLSPNYGTAASGAPLTYPPLCHAATSIQASGTMQLIFEAFHLATGDTLRIVDQDVKLQYSETFTGLALPFIARRSSGVMVTFDSNDDGNVSTGYRMTWTVDFVVPPTPPASVFTGDTYTYNLTGGLTRIVVMSPNYPNAYPSNANLNWIVFAPSGQHLAFDLAVVETELNRDLLRVFDGNDPSTQSLVRSYTGYMSNSMPARLVSDSSRLHVKFTSDGTTQLKGFYGRCSVYEDGLPMLTAPPSAPAAGGVSAVPASNGGPAKVGNAPDQSGPDATTTALIAFFVPVVVLGAVGGVITYVVWYKPRKIRRMRENADRQYALSGGRPGTAARPTTARPGTARPTTARPTTARPTTARPTTARPTTARPTTARPDAGAAVSSARPVTARPDPARLDSVGGGGGGASARPTTARPGTAARPVTSPRQNSEDATTLSEGERAAPPGAVPMRVTVTTHQPPPSARPTAVAGSDHRGALKSPRGVVDGGDGGVEGFGMPAIEPAAFRATQSDGASAVTVTRSEYRDIDAAAAAAADLPPGAVGAKALQPILKSRATRSVRDAEEQFVGETVGGDDVGTASSTGGDGARPRKGQAAGAKTATEDAQWYAAGGVVPDGDVRPGRAGLAIALRDLLDEEAAGGSGGGLSTAEHEARARKKKKKQPQQQQPSELPPLVGGLPKSLPPIRAPQLPDLAAGVADASRITPRSESRPSGAGGAASGGLAAAATDQPAMPPPPLPRLTALAASNPAYTTNLDDPDDSEEDQDW